MELILIFWVLCGILGAMISSGKNRGAGEGGCLGFILGPIGLLIAIVMPGKHPAPQVIYVNQGHPVPAPAAAPAAPPPPDPDQLDRQRQASEARQRSDEAEERRLQAEIRKLALEAEIRRHTQQQKRSEAFAYVLSFEWFKAWPDWFQAVSLGLGLALLALVIVGLGIALLT